MLTYENDSKQASTKPLETWQQPKETKETYRVYVQTIQEEDGRYSTIALNLPGTGSCGDTPEESLANAKEAIQTVLEYHKESGDPISWKTVEKTSGAKWINIHV